ncbi:hypothetical protein HanRHA438_Chr14g0664931 [Helianthus annuus]|nr:hypothetical protein HanRHA438_Chr14g0664931 [Helianthus annuus]
MLRHPFYSSTHKTLPEIHHRIPTTKKQFPSKRLLLQQQVHDLPHFESVNNSLRGQMRIQIPHRRPIVVVVVVVVVVTGC